MFVKDVHLAMGVSLKDVRGTDQVEFLFHTLAATDIAASGLKRESVTRYPGVGADQHDIDGANSNRVSRPKYSRARCIAPRRPGSARPMAI